MTAGDRFVDDLVAMFLAPGRGGHAGEDPGVVRPRFAFEYATGQHVTVTDDGVFLGWAAWYRVDDEVLGALRRGEADDWVREKRYPLLTEGPHCYIADIVVAPGAPRSVYRLLIDLVGQYNADAQSLSGHLCKRDGRERFALRINRGEPYWWRRRQTDAVLH